MFGDIFSCHSLSLCVCVCECSWHQQKLPGSGHIDPTTQGTISASHRELGDHTCQQCQGYRSLRQSGKWHSNHTRLKCKCFFDTRVFLEYLKTMMLNIQKVLVQESELLHLVRKSSSDLGRPPGSGTTLDESLLFSWMTFTNHLKWSKQHQCAMMYRISETFFRHILDSSLSEYNRELESEIG